MQTQSHKIQYALGLILLDALVLAAAFTAAYVLRSAMPLFTPVQPWNEYLVPAGVLIGLCVLIFGIQGLYRDVRDLSMLEEYAQVMKGLMYAFLAALALTFFLKLYERSRVLIVLSWFLANDFLILARFLFYRSVKLLRISGKNLLPVAIVGSAEKIKAARALLKLHRQLGYEVVSEWVLPKGAALGESARRRLEHDLCGPYAQGRLRGVILSESVKNYRQLVEVVEVLNAHGIPHRHVTEAFDLYGFKAPSGEALEALAAELDEGQVSAAYKVAKRFLDEVISLLVLAATFPLWLLIMLAIKLESPGPVFFRQERVGYLGKKFKIYKFRSMRVSAPKYAKTPRHHGDPRVTRVGAVLRKFSLDELPQLLNVIRGEMSLVGPRPEMPFLADQHKAIHRYRLLVKPGLTGLWQVSGRTDKPLEANIKYDLYYIKKQSLLLDLVILLRTIPAVLFGKGAY